MSPTTEQRHSKEILTFLSYIEDGTLHEVSQEVYKDFLNSHIKKFSIPCENVLNVFKLRKRVGAVYIELRYKNQADIDTLAGIFEEYTPKYPEQGVGYGWLTSDEGKKFYLNRSIYQSWFQDNVEHFDLAKRGE